MRKAGFVLAIAMILVACGRNENANNNTASDTGAPTTTVAASPDTISGTTGTSSTAPIAATGTEVVHGNSGAATSTIVTPTTTTQSMTTPTETTSTVVTVKTKKKA